MASHKTKGKPPDNYDPAAPLTEEEIKTLRPAREFFAERGLPMPVPRKAGRPRQDETKVRVTMRLDAGIVEHFKSQGPGWQTRINAVLAEKVAKGR
ncbi:BrnA antitoxin family protein [Devosia sp. YIM 151766]|uniref:BrnA antitoxin family protein n=1 Tax=Devosia sp. YIM 151766 TaxID=3017325 RepID=UPI00255CC516|nr:BrnA antitoxin family protein [Devosia sp. YIM 151766]WIY52664.1 BrnA antitoxin family protein [Devosia sp. YIM 151766]